MLHNIDLKIKEILKEKGLTMKELLAVIELTEQGYAYMIKNNSMKINTLETISIALERPINHFLEGFKSNFVNNIVISEQNGQVIQGLNNVVNGANEDTAKIIEKNKKLQNEIEKLKNEVEHLNRMLNHKDELLLAKDEQIKSKIEVIKSKEEVINSLKSEKEQLIHANKKINK